MSENREYVEPTDDQLVNFAAVMALGPGVTNEDKEVVRVMLAQPAYREVWRGRHRTMQEQAWEVADDMARDDQQARP